MDTHLNDEQIDELLHFRGQMRPERGGSDEVLATYLTHMEACEACKARLEGQLRTIELLALIRSTSSTAPDRDCPPDWIWSEIAGSDWSENNVRLVAHASECDHCGPLLAQTASDVELDLRPEEEEKISGLATSNRDWQHELAIRLSRPVSESASKAVHRRKLWMAVSFAVAASLVFATFLLVARLSWWPGPERLLAQAYDEHRTLELMIPGADASPLRIERGPGGSLMSQNPSLLQAEALISKHLAEQPDDPYWLQMKARADLLNWNYSEAITSLSEAQNSAGDNPALLTDLATAYFERAESNRQPGDYGRAIEQLGKVLDKNPNDQTALFNRALVLERLFLYSQALDDWRKYLVLFPKGKWATEALVHERNLQQKLDHKQSRNGQPLINPEVFTHTSSQKTDFQREVDYRVEEYAELALEDWMPRAFARSDSAVTTESRGVLRTALGQLSNELIESHHDHFLADLMAVEERGDLSEASSTLALAIKDNHAGNHMSAREEASLSEKKFRVEGNDTGVFRSQFEQAYAAQRTFDAPPCIKLAGTVVRAAHERGYTWLEAQSLIEEAFCNNLQGRVGIAASESQQASQVALNAGYHDTYLRASIGAAATAWEGGSGAQAWSLILRGLEEYWSDKGSKTRGIAFYKVMDIIAEDQRLSYLQSSIIRDYLPSVDTRRDPLEAVMTLYRLGNSELLNRHDRDAEEDFRKAQSLLALTPFNVGAQDRHILGVIGLAKVELLRGNTATSKNLLGSVQSSISQAQESFSCMDYYETLGEVEEQAGHPEDAANAYRSAIAVSERALSTLKDAQDRLTWGRTFTPAYRGLVKVKLETGDTTGALAMWEWYHALAIRTYSAPRSFRKLNTRTSLSHVDPAIDTSRVKDFYVEITSNPRENFIVYAQLGQRLVVWVMSKGQLHAEWINVNISDLTRAVNQFEAECSNPSSSPSLMRRNGRLLYDWLVGPVEKYLTTEAHITVEPDGLIEQVPMEALVYPDGQFVGARRLITLSPGIGYDSISHRELAIGSESRILIAQSDASDPGRGLIPDEAAGQEAHDVGRLFRHAVLLEGSSLNSASLRNAFRRADIFHFVGHSQVNDPQGGLIIEQQGAQAGTLILHAQDFYQMSSSHCQLAVLAACSTALGSQERWIDRDGMVLPLLNSGIPCVVASRWRVDSSTTGNFMRDFYAELLTGQSVPSSVRLVQDRVRADPLTNHPYYWAAFDVYGHCGSEHSKSNGERT